MELLTHSIYVLFILVLVVAFCVAFTNAVEHLGIKLNLNEGAVGSVLAAVGTALPETIVPLVAIIGAYIVGSDVAVAEQIGMGGILGAPFLLATLAMFVTGVAVYIFSILGKRKLEMPVNSTIMFRDLHFFLTAYSVAVFSSFVPNDIIKKFIAVGLILFYGVYVFRTVRTKCDEKECEIEDLAPLYITRLVPVGVNTEALFIVVQLFISLLGLIFCAHLFVGQLKFFALAFKINPLILSLLLTPLVTELPEKFNSILWIKAKKDTLALGNITGAMVFQSTIPMAVGLTLTPWVFGIDSWVSIILVYLSILTVYFAIIRNVGILRAKYLMLGGVFYFAYVIYVVLKANGIIGGAI